MALGQGRDGIAGRLEGHELGFEPLLFEVAHVLGDIQRRVGGDADHANLHAGEAAGGRVGCRRSAGGGLRAHGRGCGAAGRVARYRAPCRGARSGRRGATPTGGQQQAQAGERGQGFVIPSQARNPRPGYGCLTAFGMTKAPHGHASQPVSLNSPFGSELTYSRASCRLTMSAYFALRSQSERACEAWPRSKQPSSTNATRKLWEKASTAVAR